MLAIPVSWTKYKKALKSQVAWGPLDTILTITISRMQTSN